MTFFASSVVSFLLLANPALGSTLRSSSQQDADRRLSYELIANYEPRSSVTDINALDLDQAAIEDQLSMKDPFAFKKAEEIYEFGGHSKSVANVKLAAPLTGSLKKFTAVSGKNADGGTVYGVVYDDYANGASTIGIQYKTTDIQSSYVGCQVGGLAKINLKGCLAADDTLYIDGQKLKYTYDPKTENVNKRTLKKLSTDAELKMYRCDSCPHPTYRKFRDYYGHFDYADKWITAAFDGTSTELARGNGNFARYGYQGRDEAIKKGTAYMSMWMWVIKQLEQGLADCETDCTTINCNSGAVREWDEAVASYTGSLEGVSGSGSGKLLYALADKRCVNFKTCGDFAQGLEGTSHVNIQIIRNFALGQRLIGQGKCDEAKPYKESIEKLMAVPLIQGTLRYAFLTSKYPKSGDKAEVEGAVFAASVLPLVHACDEDAAETIYSNMKTGQANTANFLDVKTAFESVYSCMGIDGRNVGGLWNEETGDYHANAGPSNAGIYGNLNIIVIVGCVVGGLVLGLVLYYVVSKCCSGTIKMPIETKDDPLALSEEDEPEVNLEEPKITNAEDPLPSTNSEMEPIEIS